MGQVGPKTHRLACNTPAHQLFQSDERAAANEQDVGRIDLKEFLLSLLAAAFWRYARHRSFDNLKQRLLYTLAGNIASDRRIVALARDLVDFVDVNDAALTPLDIVIGVLQQREDDIFNVFADVPSFGQRSRVGNRERYLEKARERLCQQGLAHAGRSNQQNV